MRTIHLIDTSVYLVILEVPEHFTQDQLLETQSNFDLYQNNKDTLLLPFGTIIETGNHIADAKDGRRYDIGKKFAKDVKRAINEQTPYQLCGIPRGDKGLADFERWIEQFRELSQSGIGMVDTMCIDIFHTMQEMFPYDRVRIWSYDKRHLSSYDTHPDEIEHKRKR